jgi:hypothetical protein
MSFRVEDESMAGNKRVLELRGWQQLIGILLWCLDCVWKWVGATQGIQEGSTYQGGFDG